MENNDLFSTNSISLTCKEKGQQHVLSPHMVILFLEYAEELCIIALRKK